MIGECVACCVSIVTIYFIYKKTTSPAVEVELTKVVPSWSPIQILWLDSLPAVSVMSEISSRVKAIIVDKLGVDENEVVPTASFTNDLGADSLDTVELIMEFEREFDIQIPDDQAEKIETVGQAIQFIESSN